MFEYSVHFHFSVEHYKKACDFIEKLFKQEDIVKEKEFIDFDMTRKQTYITPKGTVTVYNLDDFYDGVSVVSDFEIQNPDWI